MTNFAAAKKYDKMTREQLEIERVKLQKEIAGPNVYVRPNRERDRRVNIYKQAIHVERLLFGDDAAQALQDKLYPISEQKALTPKEKEEKAINKEMAPIEMRGYISGRTVCRHNYSVFNYNGRERNGSDDF
ncbi:MAG: hypothetical protein J6P93_02390 [Alphaproteobacteria bacterium]|nr:hypothetical protein [Alphaproteobacteria bacterium]